MNILNKLRWELQSLMTQRSIKGHEFGVLRFCCNICGRSNEARMSNLERENRSCLHCGSTVRFRSVISALSKELFGKSLALPDFPVNKELTGAGLSDWFGYAAPLAQKLNYTNTFYHKEPRLDITDIDPALEGTLDFLISSDVFEHVAPPVSRIFKNAAALLKPGGVLVLTVPYRASGQTSEHFPELHDFKIEQHDNRRVLRNKTLDGREQVFEDLVFHGGAGMTLQLREFSKDSLIECLEKAGFHSITIHNEPDFEHGVHWKHNWSLPITARK